MDIQRGAQEGYWKGIQLMSGDGLSLIILEQTENSKLVAVAIDKDSNYWAQERLGR